MKYFSCFVEIRFIFVNFATNLNGVGASAISRTPFVFMLKNVIFRSAAVVVCLLTGAVFASAQRWTQGRPSIDAQVLFGEGMNHRGIGVNGAVVSWNMYQYLGKVSAGLDYYTHPYDYVFAQQTVLDDDGNIVVVSPEETVTYRAHDITAGGGYFFRVLSTRNRTVIFSLGASVYAGVRLCNEIGRISKGDGKNYSSVGFLLNVIPEAHFEVFPFSNVSLFLSARPRIQTVSTLAGNYGWFRFCWGFGGKFYF